MALFEKCIKQRFRSKKKGEKTFELDFIAKIGFGIENEIIVCTIGDDISFIETNINTEMIKDSDLVISAIREDGEKVETLKEFCSIKNLQFLKIKVSKSKEIVDYSKTTISENITNKKEIHKEIQSTEVNISIDAFVEKVYRKDKDKFSRFDKVVKK